LSSVGVSMVLQSMRLARESRSEIYLACRNLKTKKITECQDRSSQNAD